MADDRPVDRVQFRQIEPHTLRVELAGNWHSLGDFPGAGPLENQLAREKGVRVLELDGQAVGRWNSALVAFVLRCQDLCQQQQIAFRTENLPAGVRQLIQLAQAVPEKRDARRDHTRSSWIHRLGGTAHDLAAGTRQMLTFLGDTVLAFIRLLRGRAQFRWSDAWLVIQQCGPEALGIVALINFLVGLILAFVGAVQLTQFGAAIYVADLVAIGTVREMACIMTGIILCGRTGAAFAAQLGTMKVNEEIDAFRTFDISPIEFLVLPRVLALVLMMPLLCVFADLISIFGGFLVSISMLDVSAIEYVQRTIAAITLKSFLLGIGKGACFGVLVALAGCLRGMQCGTNAAAVGHATTSAVVTGITAIIAADGIFAVLCNALNI